MKKLHRCISGWAILVALSIATQAQAEPARPLDDNLVLATVPLAESRAAELPATVSNPQDLATALERAREAIERGRSNMDPRAYGEAQAVLAAWWDLQDPPVDVRIMRAVIRQASHDFREALVDLDAVLNSFPRHPQARLSRAFLHMVTGDIKAASADCNALPYGARGLIRSICFARVAALSGKTAKGRAVLEGALRAGGSEAAAMQRFAAIVLADLMTSQGQPADALRLYEAIGGQANTDAADFVAHADLLLDLGRHSEVLRLLEGRGDQDALLLRRAIAARHLGDPRLNSWSAILNERFAAAAAAGNRVHLREEARFRLEVENNAAQALPLAIDNFAVQKEPADLRLLLEAARAANSPEAAKQAIEFLAATGLQDARLKPLQAQLERQ